MLRSSCLTSVGSSEHALSLFDALRGRLNPLRPPQVTWVELTGLYAEGTVCPISFVKDVLVSHPASFHSLRSFHILSLSLICVELEPGLLGSFPSKHMSECVCEYCSGHVEVPLQAIEIGRVSVFHFEFEDWVTWICTSVTIVKP